MMIKGIPFIWVSRCDGSGHVRQRVRPAGEDMARGERAWTGCLIPQEKPGDAAGLDRNEAEARGQMGNLKHTVALLLTTLTTACSLASSPPLSPYDSLPGKWGWEGSDDCTAAPEEIRFSQEGGRMHILLSPKGEDGTRAPRREAAYTVTGRAGNVLSMTLDGEERVDDGGKPVTWDLVMLESDRYCWRRGDWRQGECTAPLRRCPG